MVTKDETPGLVEKDELDRVRSMHKAGPRQTIGGTRSVWCERCSEAWPCRTTRWANTIESLHKALTTAEEEAGHEEYFGNCRICSHRRGSHAEDCPFALVAVKESEPSQQRDPGTTSEPKVAREPSQVSEP